MFKNKFSFKGIKEILLKLQFQLLQFILKIQFQCFFPVFMMTTEMAEKQVIEDSYLKFVNEDNSLYNLEVLSKDNSDYKLVEKSIINTCCEFEKENFFNIKIERICKIHQKVPVVKTDATENVLVFHGTPRKNIEGILNCGFKPSKS